jgi:DNA-binding transcriptional MerR regulator
VTFPEPSFGLLISELAKAAGVTARTIRHYEAVGLLAPPPRDASGYRRYSPATLTRLLRIRRLRGLGMPVPQIAGVLDEAGTSAITQTALLALAAVTEAEIDRLRRLVEEVVSLAETPGLDADGSGRG